MAEHLEVVGPAAPPRDNGELVFDAPWQGRAFAMAVALHESGRFTWDEFRDELVLELGSASDASPDAYWAAWLRATENVLSRRDLVPAVERCERLRAYAVRPADHDHDHDHDHPRRGGGGDQDR